MTTTGTHAYAIAAGARLREVRTQQGLSLQGVEEKSRGRWKVSAVGAYERGDRMASVRQLSELAAFYGVPVGEVLPGGSRLAGREQGDPLAFDLARVPPRSPLGLWVARVQRQRGDWAGRVLTVRASDERALAAACEVFPQDLRKLLREWGVLAEGARLEELRRPLLAPKGRRRAS